MQDQDRYCIVGAGPNGLIMARALRKAAIPYDHFELHSDVGGLWNIENPASPVYERAKFISSKPTSNFYGFPLPDDYPDFPDHRMLTEYIRDFAMTYGVYDKISFGTGIKRARQLGDGRWSCELTSGETRTYAGLICANGTNWHPVIPDYPGMSEFTGEMRHSVTYTNPAELQGHRVLILGLGNSGADIAADAAEHAAHTRISVRRGYRIIPKYVFGIPTDQWSFGLQPTPAEIEIKTEDMNALLDALVGDLTRFGMPTPDHNVLESHPILNDGVLAALRSGKARIVPDVAGFTRHGARFVDGSEDSFDLVLFATGYEWRVPYLDPNPVPYDRGRPVLYLNAFPREVRNLYFAGFCDFADGGFMRWNELAHLIVMDLTLKGLDQERWERQKRSDEPVLSDIPYVDSPRHLHYVDTFRFQEIVKKIYADYRWPRVDDAFYEDLRTEVSHA